MRLMWQTAIVAATLTVCAAGVFFAISRAPALAGDEEAAASIIGAVGTIFAGWLAWAAVQRQIATELEQRQADARRSTVGDLNLACACVVRVGNYLIEQPRLMPDPFAVETLRALIAPCMRLDATVGIALSSCVHELDLMALTRREKVEPSQLEGQLGFRCFLLARALERARNQVEAGNLTIAHPLIQPKDVEAERDRRKQPDADLLFVDYLMSDDPITIVAE